MTFRESLRTKFLRWVSDYFDVAIIVATQKPGIEIGNIYLLDTGGDPFRETFYVKVCDIRGDYIQYAACDINGRVSEFCTKMSNPIKTFKVCYKEVKNAA